MNKKINFIPAIGIVALCAILVGTIVVLVTMQTKNAVKTSFSPEEEDETIDWKTYRDENRGFEIKYPENWQAITFFLGGQDIPKQERAIAIHFTPSETDIYKKGGEIIIYISPATGTVFCPIKQGDSTCIDGQESEIVIDDVNGVLREGKTTEFCPPDNLLFLTKGREIKEIYLCNLNNYFRFTAVKQQEKIFDQMLSTFKFIEKELIAEVTPSIKILSPKILSVQSSDEALILIKGSLVNIEWKAENIAPLGIDIKLIYSTDRETEIVSNIPNTTKSYKWIIPQDIETGYYRISVTTNDETYGLGSTYDISNSFIISSTTSIKPVIDSVSPQEVSIGSTIVITGENFDPIGATATIGWATHSHIFVYMKDSQDQEGILFEALYPPAKDRIAIEIPSEICTLPEAAGGCNPIPITPGQYLLNISVDGRGVTNEVQISIQ